MLYRSAYCDSPSPSERGTTSLENSHDFTVSETKWKVLELYRAIEFPPVLVCQSLIEAYFDHCWTWMPVVDPSLRETAATTFLVSLTSTKPGSLLLMNAMLLAGSRMRKGTKQYLSSEDFYARAKILVDLEIERNPQHLLPALCMMQWWNTHNPRDVSTNSSRFWITYAIGIAQQMGLHTSTPHPSGNKRSWKLIWWTLYDFPSGYELQCMLFCNFVKISEIISDICRTLTRHRRLSWEMKKVLVTRLLEWIENLPGLLRLYNANGSTRPYHFDIAQLHIYYLIALCILFRPCSISGISPENSAAVLASSLCHRLLEGIQVRDQMSYLGPIFSWCILVAAIPQLSCAVFPSLWKGSQYKLDDLEGFLTSLESKWPSARFNIGEIHRLREVADSVAANRLSMSRGQSVIEIDSACAIAPEKLFGIYGEDALQSYEQIYSSLSPATPAEQQLVTPALPQLQRLQQPLTALVPNSIQEFTSTALSPSNQTALLSEGISLTSEITPILSNDAFSFDENWYEMDWADLLAETGAHDLN
ncbi:uncharacterized protein A1O9_08648 [Exophiala aquamarina CBS 119918]|uniref:Xylanolytic transcriptional activator regulatory domain-containing protein n=1 Tax=Exophiala aquamarina CBS 119918 TaxID=1182545 RepID=A0A072P554_9EURO|nr:uncharacterized protein A1O9_08648 [Exophiala aquamarina CBS 119918]KEF54996.1 hypothetical protein A1O9_08648 [Exophiala aquamarina CBS 119918]